ncbi:MATE family efflux transporter [Neisseriaceae bacterium JH1-16]|nr:MATE family efflux transporter [Neisseriaceae bacterium JH1-16]
MLFELKRAPRAEIRREAGTLIQLALPMLIAQVAQVGTGFVDTVMAGRVGTGDLAAAALGSSVFITLYVTLMGVATSLNPILSQLYGAGDKQAIGETGRQGLWFGLLLGLFGMALMFALQPLLRAWLTLPTEVEDKIMLFITGAALGMPAAMMHRALHAYASSLNRPKAIMYVSITALLLNIPLNYMFIHGLFGLPKMGGAGCGWATGTVFWFNAIALFCYIALNRYFKPFGLTERFSRPNLARFKEFLHLGVPMGLSYFVEVSLFTFIAFLITGFGTVYVASQQAVINFCSLIYMVPQSVAVALSVRVGQSIGAGDPHRARFISALGLVIGFTAALGTALLVLVLRTPIMQMYSTDPEVVVIGATLLIFAAFFQLSDATQTIASGALRGYKLTTVPMLIHSVSFWGVGLGLGSWLGLSHGSILGYVRPMGVYGFWIALVISLTAAAILLVSYLSFASRRHLAASSHHKAVTP